MTRDGTSPPEDNGYFAKLASDDPENYVFQALARIEKGDTRKVDRTPTPEIEDQDPIELGRTGECDLALEVLLETYPDATPHRLAHAGADEFRHVFLMWNSEVLDISGITSLDALRDYYRDAKLVAFPTTTQEIRKRFQGHGRTPEEKRRIRAHFRRFIRENRKTRFP